MRVILMVWVAAGVQMAHFFIGFLSGESQVVLVIGLKGIMIKLF